MKKFASVIMILVATFVFSNTLAFAEGKGKKVEFTRDVLVNGTEVKKGKYTVKFDDQTNEMSIWQGDKLVAKSNARKGQRKTKAATTEVMVVKKDNATLLKGIILEGQEETILLGETVNVTPQ
jgi:hypothetical protein